MEHTKFFEHYQICTSATDSPQEIGRTGAAIVYKGTDVRSNEPVALQLIPIASLDSVTREQFEQRARSAQKLDHVNIARVLEVGTEHNFLVLVSEFVEGETTDAWVVANGPMPLEAVLHVALQVVRALEAAAFFSLTHRALQPANILIFPGSAPDGGWPFIKLLNFGLASAEAHASETPGAALAPAISPQFASPEQLRSQPIDFASEVYSLGATICFLLTGAAPLAGATSRERRRLPRLPRVSRRLRKLLEAMLSEAPELRPQDPVALEKELLEFLTKVEKRGSIRKKLGIPTFATLPKWTASSRPAAQILRGAIAFALLMLVGAGVTAAFFPRVFHFARSADQLGVPVGVPDSVPPAATRQSPPAQVVTTPSPVTIAANNQTPQPGSPESQPNPAPANAPTDSPEASVSSNRVATTENSTAASETEGKTVASNSTRNESSEPGADTTEETASRPSKTKERSATSNSRHSRFADSQSDQFGSQRQSRSREGYVRAVTIGRTPDGRPILRLPSGRVIIATRGESVPEYQAPRPRRVDRQPDFDGDDRAPWQPFNNYPRD